ncbi:MAG: hypothetical protein F7B61_02005, partial [Caldisphaeraceae archaeon]|nr:hypothetical protein [Caldisphaeraceae archaeon]
MKAIEMEAVGILLVIAVSMIMGLSYTIPYISLQGSYEIPIRNNTLINIKRNGTYYILNGNFATSVLNITKGSIYVEYFLQKDFLLLIMYREGVSFQILNFSLRNFTETMLASLAFRTNLSGLRLQNVFIGKYSGYNIPGINESVKVLSENKSSVVVIDMPKVLKNIVSFNQNSWTTFEFSGENGSFIAVTFGVISNVSLSNRGLPNNNIIVLSKGTNFQGNEFHIIYYILFALLLAIVPTMLV